MSKSPVIFSGHYLTNEILVDDPYLIQADVLNNALDWTFHGCGWPCGLRGVVPGKTTRFINKIFFLALF